MNGRAGGITVFRHTLIHSYHLAAWSMRSGGQNVVVSGTDFLIPGARDAPRRSARHALFDDLATTHPHRLRTPLW